AAGAGWAWRAEGAAPARAVHRGRHDRRPASRRGGAVRELAATPEPDETATTLPAGAGLALIGTAMMIVGAFGPWIGGKVFGAPAAIELGGGGWLVLCAC